MSDYIVTNSPLQAPQAQGDVLNTDQFLTLATSDEGLPVDTLYVNIAAVDQELFEMLQESMDGIVYFTEDGVIPAWVNVQVADWAPAPAPGSETEDDEDGFGFQPVEDEKLDDISGLFTESVISVSEEGDNINNKEAKVYLFGSSKGGTGKTFTSLLSARRYAKTHPTERIAFLDFDIVDGQVGITIHKFTPTLDKFYKEYCKGHGDDFNVMKEFRVKNEHFPANMDFYLAPKDFYIDDNDFWMTVLYNAISNYDTVIFDTGIDYLHYAPISYAYKVADKILLVSTTSIKSVNSVLKQIKRLKGDIRNEVFDADDEMGPKINVIITQCSSKDKSLNETICKNLQQEANIVARFGQMSEEINQAEFFGYWDIFDHKKAIQDTLDRIMS